MKKLITLLLLLPSIVLAQATQKMSYQSVVRNASNQVVANQNIGVKISILEGTIDGAAVYSETHQAITNTNGLFTIEVGGGTIVTGAFSNINWGNGSHYIKSEIDITGGSNYSLSGTKELLSVPYALYAANSTTPNYTIGLSLEQGGYIFWLSNDGKHGLVAETQDQGNANWYNAQNLISDPSNHSTYGQNFRDWRMPTAYELNEMYLNKVAIGGFTDNLYYCSTELSLGVVSNIHFFNGSKSAAQKEYQYIIRSVRSF